MEDYRRKFRSQTSDNMDRWKSRGGKSQRGGEEERRSEKRAREREREREGESDKKEDASARKGTSREKLCFSNALRCGTKYISKSKVLKTDHLGPPLEVEMSKKCTPMWREVKSAKNHWGVWGTFGRSDAVLRGRRKGFCILPKVSKA